MNKTYLKILLFFIVALLLLAGARDLSASLRGSGSFLGEYSSEKGLLLIAYLGGSFLILLGLVYALWQPDKADRIAQMLIRWREKLGILRWVLFGLVILLPVWVLQNTAASKFLDGSYLRLDILLGMGLLAGILMTVDQKRLLGAQGASLAFLFAGLAFLLGKIYAGVGNYPFSLHWSEGNRMFDYSALFGRELYDFPADQPIFAYISIGRQALWGLPFLLPSPPIWLVRLWSAVLFSVPYAIFGWIVFRRFKNARLLWLLVGLWALLLLGQAPIYTPLVLSAILVAIAWRSPIWLALPLLVGAGYYAEMSRYTWMFAPAMWVGMLYLADSSVEVRLTNPRSWGKALAGVAAGLLGGYFLPRWLPPTQLAGWLFGTVGAAADIAPAGDADVVSVQGVSEVVGRQVLLWSRLLPNPTYGLGIILAVALVTLPLVIVLVYLVRTRRWSLNWIQKLAVLAPLLIFLGVGLVVSVKIGGGNNLHNMDMYLIGLVFAAGVAWKAGGYQLFARLEDQSKRVQWLVVIMMACLAYQPILNASPYRMASAKETRQALEGIRAAVAAARSQGEVLFLDQRQLLTFGLVKDVPLVVDYEKKYLMDQAMSNDAAYFEQFSADLASQRFALIISEPLKLNYQGSDSSFGEENDAWVRWVSEPVLCYYEPVELYKTVRVMLLVPREFPQNCP